jgi:hypothetical protein
MENAKLSGDVTTNIQAENNSKQSAEYKDGMKKQQASTAATNKRLSHSLLHV